MCSCFLTHYLLLFLLVHANFTFSKKFYIRTMLDNSCPRDNHSSSCVTLSQFIAADYDYNETDIHLLFLPGHHTLIGELFLTHKDNFSMTKYAQGNETVFIECTNRIDIGRFDIKRTTSAYLNGLNFIGCGNNRVTNVIWLTIADSTFHSVEDKSTVLELYNIDTAKIVRSHFLYNTLDGHNNAISSLYLTLEQIPEYVYQRYTSTGVLYTAFSNVSVIGCVFMHNRADTGGALAAHNSRLHIERSSYSYNRADFGGVMVTSASEIDICNCNFMHNLAQGSGGVLIAYNDRFSISNTAFVENTADGFGGCGVMVTFSDSSFLITTSSFIANRGSYVGVVITSGDSSFTISDSTFAFNNGTFEGIGVMSIFKNSSFTITNTTFAFNHGLRASVIVANDKSSSFSIVNSNFTSNRGTVIATYNDSLFTITNTTFVNNIALPTNLGGVIFYTRGTLAIYRSNFSHNALLDRGGIVFIYHCYTHIADTIFDNNAGSVMMVVLNSNLTFSGTSKFENSTKYLNVRDASADQGTLTCSQSTVVFARESTTLFSNNQAKGNGAAISADKSTVLVNGETIIANMIVTSNNISGAISLCQSHLDINGKCNIFNNSAVRGGGIHASSSTVAVYQPGILEVVNNNAEFGGGMYLEINSKLYVLKTLPTFNADNYVYYLNFIGNKAKRGGAVYLADDTNSGTCSPNNECFIQTLLLYPFYFTNFSTLNILFSGNSATEQGSNIFGGLLDRCIPNTFAEARRRNGISYLQSISNAPLDSISSQAVSVCFCNREYEPDCSYQLPTVRVKKGEAFNVSVVAVDQVNNTVEAKITTSISSSDGGFGEGQQTQNVGRNCSELTFNVFSPHDYETINLFADGPCGSAALSTSHVSIQFNDCSCPVGFESLSNSKSSTRCECVCDSKLSTYITNCEYLTGSLFRVGTKSWITYVNDTDPPGYITYPYCPFDYCQPPTKQVSINFNVLNGADTQCDYNRTGVLCGSCGGYFSLSLASSHCLPCHSHWPAVCVAIVLAAIIAGILLVATLLALNMTVSIGLVNSFSFYANLVSAGSYVFFPSSDPSFPSVFVAWLNLDIGIDVCFIDGLDAYIKTWLQLAFPVYVIILVVMVIIVSEYSPRFAGLIGRKDPVSTLATLILLSYSKLLSVTITALSFARLDYPDGKQEIVWLPDGNVKYFQGKHIPLVLVAVLIFVIGLPYTILLFLWQWIARAPRWKVFKWTRNAKLNVFIATHHIPYNTKYRYWTGLLLLIRVVLYIIASATVSSIPQTFPLVSIILLGCLFLFKGMFGLRVYKNSVVDNMDTLLCFNLLVLAAFSQFDFPINDTKQTTVAHVSTIIVCILFIGSIFYHIKLLIIKEKPQRDLIEYTLVPVQPANTEVTHSVIELPQRDLHSHSDNDIDESEITEDRCNVSPP